MCSNSGRNDRLDDRCLEIDKVYCLPIADYAIRIVTVHAPELRTESVLSIWDSRKSVSVECAAGATIDGRGCTCTRLLRV
jgi:hypothetical protein